MVFRQLNMLLNFRYYALKDENGPGLGDHSETGQRYHISSLSFLSSRTLILLLFLNNNPRHGRVGS